MKSELLPSEPLTIAADQQADQKIPSAISPELSGFLELIGNALAKEWIKQNACAASRTPYDICM
jgi:hypothetical protein